MSGSQQVVNSSSADGVGHVMILREKGVDVIDILTGERRSVAFQYPSEQILKGVFEPFHNVRISPDGQWVAYSGWDDNQFFSLEGMPDHGLVLKIDKAK